MMQSAKVHSGMCLSCCRRAEHGWCRSELFLCWVCLLVSPFSAAACHGYLASQVHSNVIGSCVLLCVAMHEGLA